MFYNVKPDRKEVIYQVFIDNKLKSVTRERMAAIKIRNLAQNNGYLAEIRKTNIWRASKDCLEMLKLLEDGK